MGSLFDIASAVFSKILRTFPGIHAGIVGHVIGFGGSLIRFHQDSVSTVVYAYDRCLAVLECRPVKYLYRGPPESIYCGRCNGLLLPRKGTGNVRYNRFGLILGLVR